MNNEVGVKVSKNEAIYGLGDALRQLTKALFAKAGVAVYFISRAEEVDGRKVLTVHYNTMKENKFEITRVVHEAVKSQPYSDDKAWKTLYEYATQDILNKIEGLAKYDLEIVDNFQNN